jgi:RNA polymerase sigma-70 factor (ECF subfamily)
LKQLSEQEFLRAIEMHKGILYKVSRMYFDKLEDQQDLFQEIIL